MKYLEFIQNEETQMVEMIRFSEDAVSTFFQQMEVAKPEEREELIKSLYVEVLIHTVENLNLEEGEGFTLVEFSGRMYEIHNHLFTSYLVSLFYNSQYWDILLDVIASLTNIEEDEYYNLTFRNLHEKLTEEPIENFVKEVQIVNPEYSINS